MTEELHAIRSTLAEYIANFMTLRDQVGALQRRFEALQTEIDEEVPGRDRIDELDDRIAAGRQSHEVLTGRLNEFYTQHRLEHEQLAADLRSAGDLFRSDAANSVLRLGRLEDLTSTLAAAVDAGAAVSHELRDGVVANAHAIAA